MSDYAAISVYANGSLVDARIYRGRPIRDLLYEALATWALYGTGPSPRAYLAARYGRPGRRPHLAEALELCNAQMILDLTNQAVYYGFDPLTRQALDCRKEVSPRQLRHGSAWKALRGTFIDLRAADPAAVRAAFRDWEGLETRISPKTCEKLEEIA